MAWSYYNPGQATRTALGLQVFCVPVKDVPYITLIREAQGNQDPCAAGASSQSRLNLPLSSSFVLKLVKSVAGVLCRGREYLGHKAGTNAVRFPNC